MTRYPVHVGSIPAYALAEMDRINEPYRKERAMTDDQLLFPTTDARRWATEFVRAHGGDEALMLTWFANAIEHGRGPDPVSEPVEPHELWQQANGDRARYLELMREHGHIIPGERPAGQDIFGHPVSEPVDGLREASMAVIACGVGNLSGDKYRARVAAFDALDDALEAALAAAPAEERGGWKAVAHGYRYSHHDECGCENCRAYDAASDEVEGLAARQSGDPR